ncbi:MAG: (2Fe-2S)-binding protein, partial [Thermoleophilaceae bacterium]
AAAPQDDSALVCTCNEVSRAAILAVARDRGLKRVEEVTEATRACSGCGSCTPAVEALLAELAEERRAELRSARPTAAEPA